MSQPKILLWDLETSGIIASTWNLYPESIPHQNLIADWYIICGCFKELGSNKVKSVSVLDDAKRFKKDHRDDYYVVKTLRDILDDVDVLIHQNGDRFDLKVFNTRLIKHNLPPLPKLLTVDTLKEVKKIAKFTSNRLDFLGDQLLGSGKTPTSPGLWMKASSGDPKAVKEMITYCKGDVNVLEGLYNRLLPYMKSHPHIGAMKGEDKNHSCPKCGSTNLIKNQTKYTAAGLPREQYQCKDCHSYSTAPKEKIK